MMTKEIGLQQKIRNQLRTVWATLGLVGLILLVYTVQLAIVGRAGENAAHQAVKEVLVPNAGLYLFLSPLFHSYHGHIAQNAILLLVSGSLTERRVGSYSVLLFVYLTGVATNILPPILGYGGFGVGISGAFYGLWIFAGIAYIIKWREEVDSEGRNVKKLLGYLLIGLVGLGFGVAAPLQFLGMLPSAKGAAKGAHLTGVVIGIFWFMARPITLPAWQDLISRRA